MISNQLQNDVLRVWLSNETDFLAIRDGVFCLSYYYFFNPILLVSNAIQSYSAGCTAETQNKGIGVG